MAVERLRRLALLSAMRSLGGGGTKAQVLDAVEAQGLLSFDERDLETMSSRDEIRWRNDLAFVRKHLVLEGYVSDHRRNEWRITAQGVKYLEALERSRPVMRAATPHAPVEAAGDFTETSAVEGEAMRVIDDIVALRTRDLTADEDVSPAGAAFEDVVGLIRDAYHRDWEKTRLALAREFLARTWTGIPLPVLSVCGRGTQEIRHSTYLGYFLDGSKPHGLGTRYLDAVLSELSVSGVDTYESVVETEKWIGDVPGRSRSVGCYCDIVITTGDQHVIFIEQKVKSGESPHADSNRTQLQRYDTAIMGNRLFDGMTPHRVFLTREGKQSSGSPNWAGLSYHDLVSAGLILLRAGGLSTTARENLKRFLIDISLGPYDKAEDEILELRRAAEGATLTTEFRERLIFDQLWNRNLSLVALLMEG